MGRQTYSLFSIPLTKVDITTYTVFWKPTIFRIQKAWRVSKNKPYIKSL